MVRNWAAAAAMIFMAAQFLRADEKYMLREKAEVGRTSSFEVVFDNFSKTDTKIDGKAEEHAEWHTRDVLKGTATVLGAKDGSAVAMRVEIDPSSGMTSTEKDKPPVMIKSPFGGKTIVLRRRANESVANDFKGDASKEALHELGSLLDPDQDNFPDHPVGIGDTWEISQKIAKRAELGPKDQLLAHCRLDSVSKVDGREVASVGISAATVTFDEDSVETDIGLSGEMKVDLATGQVLRAELKGPSKSSSTTMMDIDGAKKKVQVSRTGEVGATSISTPSTKPSK